MKWDISLIFIVNYMISNNLMLDNKNKISFLSTDISSEFQNQPK